MHDSQAGFRPWETAPNSQSFSTVPTLGIYPSRGCFRRPSRTHFTLLLITLVCCFYTGTTFSERFAGAGLGEQFTELLKNPVLLLLGAPYAVPLLLILAVHEMGHFVAARRAGVDVTWPYFIPGPPNISLGTFGAFIKIREMIPDKNTLMRIGAFGPLAGFAASIAAIATGYALLEAGYRCPADFFGANVRAPIAFWCIRGAITGNWNSVMLFFENPIVAAGWIGLFFQGLNMLPVGQLDGGHVLYAFFGRKHSYISGGILLMLLLLAVREPQWVVWVGLLLLLGFRHPPCRSESEPLGAAEKVCGAVSLLIFFLSFHPAPFEF